MIDPRFMTFDDWAGQTVQELVSFGDPPVPTHGDDWTDWAETALDSFPASNIPLPGLFSRWQDWATEFNRAVFGG